MTKRSYICMMIALLTGVAVQSIHAATINTWRGSSMAADWSEGYKWKLNHPPAEGEAAHFRDDNSVIYVNSTVQLDNGMHLYGDELMLKGNGNINLWSMVPHERTVNIPASATGFANLTLCDNLSLNGRISLSAKGFGTSASKGSITLKDRSTVTGDLSVGNHGVGSGQVYIKDNATFRIKNLDLNTEAKKGGMAEIHILGGTVRIDAEKNLFDTLMADPSRKIIIGDAGTLRIESNLPLAEKKAMMKDLISKKRLVAAPGCRLSPPILQDGMMIARAEDASFGTNASNDELLAKIDNMSGSTPSSSTPGSGLGELINDLHKEVNNQQATDGNADGTDQKSGKPRLAGYIVFFGTVLLALRRAPEEES